MEKFLAQFLSPDYYVLVLLIAGLTVLGALILPKVLKTNILSAPIVFLGIGMLVFSLPYNFEVQDFESSPYLVKRLTELVVIISLTAAGLKINAPFKKETWRISRWLLIIAMPITMILCGLLGYFWMGFVPATAFLFAAVIAPTDPVLASEIQTSGPDEEDTSPTRIALTTEAGVNDGLAFPFTYFAMSAAALGLNYQDWILTWVLDDLIYKIVFGILTGIATGKLLGLLTFDSPLYAHIPKIKSGIMVICLTLISYSVAELFHSYGFIAVFIAACVFRNEEKSHEYQKDLHDFSEDLERILVAILFLILGGYLIHHVIDIFTFQKIAVALIVILIVRPLAGYLSLWRIDLMPIQKFTIAFFGIRGMGSLYYLAFATYSVDFLQSDDLVALVVLIVVLSTFIHGISVFFIHTRLHEAEKNLN